MFNKTKCDENIWSTGFQELLFGIGCYYRRQSKIHIGMTHKGVTQRCCPMLQSLDKKWTHFFMPCGLLGSPLIIHHSPLTIDHRPSAN